MPATVNATLLASLADTVPSEQIDEYISQFAYAESVAHHVAWIRAMQRGGGNVAVWPRWNAISVPAGTKTEGDTFSVVEATTDSVTAAVAYRGFVLEVSREVQFDSQVELPRTLVDEAMTAMVDAIDSDLLGLTVDASNQFDAAGSLSITQWRNALLRWRLLNPRSGPEGFCAILHPAQIADLGLDFVLSTSPGAARVDATSFGANSAYIGTVDGIHVFSSTNVPTDDGDYCGCITSIGNNYCGLAMAVSEPVNIELHKQPTRKTDELVIAARYAVARANESRLLTVRSTAA